MSLPLNSSSKILIETLYYVQNAFYRSITSFLFQEREGLEDEFFALNLNTVNWMPRNIPPHLQKTDFEVILKSTK